MEIKIFSSVLQRLVNKLVAPPCYTVFLKKERNFICHTGDMYSTLTSRCFNMKLPESSRKKTYNWFTSVSPAVAAAEWATSISLSFSRKAARCRSIQQFDVSNEVTENMQAKTQRERESRTSNGPMLAVDLKNLSRNDPSSEKKTRKKGYPDFTKIG